MGNFGAIVFAPLGGFLIDGGVILASNRAEGEGEEKRPGGKGGGNEQHIGNIFFKNLHAYFDSKARLVINVGYGRRHWG